MHQKRFFYWLHLELNLYSGGTQFALDITKFCGYKQLLYWQEAIWKDINSFLNLFFSLYIIDLPEPIWTVKAKRAKFVVFLFFVSGYYCILVFLWEIGDLWLTLNHVTSYFQEAIKEAIFRGNGNGWSSRES